jgi:hypothetical protein
MVFGAEKRVQILSGEIRYPDYFKPLGRPRVGWLIAQHPSLSVPLFPDESPLSSLPLTQRRIPAKP